MFTVSAITALEVSLFNREMRFTQFPSPSIGLDLKKSKIRKSLVASRVVSDYFQDDNVIMKGR